MLENKITKKKQEKHQLILDAAEKLMIEKGLYSLNMDEVAALSNLAKGTLYLYFKSKEEIFAALTLKARVLLLNDFKEAVSKTNKPIEQLKGIINANYAYLKKYPLYYELVSFYEINNRETETTEMASVIGKITELVINIIIEGKKCNDINKDIDPVVLSISMWGMTVGIMQLIKVKSSLINNDPNLSEIKIVGNYIAVFCNGIK